jgi:hypothetical protein
VARVKAEADARLQHELERVREEAVATHWTLAETQAQTVRDAAIQEARTAAEEAAARALEAEVARVRAETEARLEGELARVRAEADQARLEQEQAQLDAHNIRAVAAREARAAAEAAAAQALETQVATVREEADARLHTELERVRREAEFARVMHQEDAEKIREAAAKEARAIAEAALHAETDRARAEANARLQQEIASLRADAERRQALELEAIRADVSRLREAATEEARAAAAAAVAGEVARAKTTVGTGSVSTARPGARGELAAGWNLTALRVPERARRALLPAAAVLLMAAAGGVGLSALRSGGEGGWLGAARNAAAGLFGEETPALSVPADTPTVPAAPAKAPARRAAAAKKPASDPKAANAQAVDAKAPDALTVGFLTIYSRIPLEISSGGRSLGTTEDGQLVMTAGSHEVVLVNDRFRFRTVVQIGVEPGKNTAYTVALPSGSVQVDTTPGAEVWVEGERVGVAPLAEIAVPIGTREVTVRHPELGERSQSVEVAVGQTAHVSVLLARTDAPPVAAPRLAPLSMAPAPRTPVP